MGALDKSGRTQVMPTMVFGPNAPADPLLDGIRQLVRDDYEVFGEIGRDADGAVAYLARELKANTIVAFKASPGAGGQYDLELVAELREDVPAGEKFCGHCGGKIRAWGRFCTHCGKELLPDTERYSADELRKAVQAALQDRFEILGDMRSQEGRVYFARERKTGKIQALRLTAQAGDEFAIRVTRAFEALALSRKPTAAAPPPPAAPPPRPAPPPPPPPQPAPVSRPPGPLGMTAGSVPPVRPDATATRQPAAPTRRVPPARKPSLGDRWEQVKEMARERPLVAVAVALAVLLVFLVLVS
jgi:hypothetical protein